MKCTLVVKLEVAMPQLEKEQEILGDVVAVER
jgi:hypothetical protein